MKYLSIALASTLVAASACLADPSVSEHHVYKGTVPIPNEIFDPTMDCGLNLDEVEKCIKNDRSSGQGESFCNDVKLYAGNSQKLKEANEAIKKNPAMKDMQMHVIRTISDLQAKYTHQFMDAGLKPEQIGKIPPLKRGDDANFKCKKIS